MAGRRTPPGHTRQDGGMVRRSIALSVAVVTALAVTLATGAQGTDERGARVLAFTIASVTASAVTTATLSAIERRTIPPS